MPGSISSASDPRMDMVNFKMRGIYYMPGRVWSSSSLVKMEVAPLKSAFGEGRSSER